MERKPFMVTGLTWKCNAEHEVGEEVMLDAYAPEPSSTPNWFALTSKGTGRIDEGSGEILRKDKRF